MADLLARGVAVHILNLGRIDDTPTGKLTMHVMLAFAEYEKDMIKERLAAGREVAKQKPGFHEGRPKKFAPERIEAALDLIRGGKSYSKAAAATGISRSTLLRAMKKARATESVDDVIKKCSIQHKTGNQAVIIPVGLMRMRTRCL